jgi:hypothetical protein
MVVFEGGIGYNTGDIAFLTPFVWCYTFAGTMSLSWSKNVNE